MNMVLSYVHLHIKVSSCTINVVNWEETFQKKRQTDGEKEEKEKEKI